MTDHGHSAASNAPQTTLHGPAGPGAGHGHDGGHDAHEAHGGLAQYMYVFIALCVLTTASFFTYSSYWPFQDTPQVGWAFMMAVSCTKAMLVILFFMHVKYEANWKYVLTVPCAFMGIFLMLALVPDVGLRNRQAAPEARAWSAEPRAGREHGSAQTQRGKTRQDGDGASSAAHD